MTARRKIRLAILLAAALAAAPAHRALAQQTYTFTLLKGPGAALLWPNAGGSPNDFEAREGLLGRVLTTAAGGPITNPNQENACALPPSYSCASGSPPAFLLPAGTAEGPSGAGGGDECNRETVACESAAIPSAGHGGHPGGDSVGTYSYLMLHTSPGCSELPAGRSIAFLSGNYSYEQDPYLCNDCPPAGHGKRDGASPSLLRASGPAARVGALDLDLWATQVALPFLQGSFGTGHMKFTLSQAGPGEVSYCGNGVLYQDVLWDFCRDGLEPGTGDIALHQKVRLDTYAVNAPSQHGSPWACEGPDCYVENVVIPNALQQDINTLNVQVLRTYAVFPPPVEPCLLGDSTLEGLIYAFTTQRIDIDGDGTEDRVDPCPNDPADACVNDLLGGGTCPGGQVFCMDASGAPGCFDPALCDTRRDVNKDCGVDSTDINSVFGTLFFNTGLPIGPFEP